MHPHSGMIILTVVLTLFALRILRRIFWRRHFYRHGWYGYGPGGCYGYHGYYGPWGRYGCGDSFYY
jgi:hypothetical protein